MVFAEGYHENFIFCDIFRTGNDSTVSLTGMEGVYSFIILSDNYGLSLPVGSFATLT